MTVKLRKELSCLYFPYADPQPSSGLLMAALLFDRIYFLETDFFRPPEERLGKYVIGRISHDLKNIGIFREIGPDLMGFGKHFGLSQPVLDKSLLKEIQASVIADLNNPELSELVAQSHKLYWRIPNGQFLFWNGLGILFEISKNQNDVSALEILTSRPDYYGPFIERAGYKKVVQSYEDARIRNVPEELTVKVPFLTAEALMTTVSLLACTEFGLIPFTDNLLHHQYLMLKIKNIMQLISSQTAFTDLLQGVSYTQIGTQSMELSLPKLENLTAEKVSKLRENCKDELERFRTEVLKMVYDIESTPWDPEHQHELGKLIETKVHPAVIELEDKLRSLKEKFGIGLVQKGLTTAPLPFLLNIFVGLPVAWVLPLSIGAISLTQSIEYFQQRSELKRNGLSFLLNLL